MICGFSVWKKFNLPCNDAPADGIEGKRAGAAKDSSYDVILSLRSLDTNDQGMKSLELVL